MRRWIRLLALVALLAAVLPPGVARGASTLTVCAVGCDHTTIGAAIAAAADGDTIEIGPGSYVEDGLSINKSLTLRGEPPAPAVADPQDLLTPGVLQTVVQTTGPGAGPTFTLASPAAGAPPVVRFENLSIVGNDDFDTIRIASNDPVLIQSVAFHGVALTESRTAINTVGLRPIHGLRVINSAVTCTGASNPTGGILLGVADGVGDAIAVSGSYLAQCGWAINAGNHAGFGAANAVAGAVTIIGNRMEENEFGCVIVALSYADLTISGNAMTNCDRQNGSFNGAVDVQALAPPTNVKVLGNDIARAGPTTAGNVGVIIQNMPASPGNLARVLVAGNHIHDLTFNATSDAIRLGPTLINRAPADIDIDIVGNALLRNTRGFSWQTNVGNNLQANLDLERNRIVGSLVGNRRAIAVFGSGRHLEFENNWFGCNAGPSVGVPATPCDSVGVNAGNTVDFEPWLVLSIDAAPTAITPFGDTSAVTAGITTNSDGDPIAAAIPDGAPIAFATDLGAVAPPTAPTIGGTAGSTLTSGATSGTATVQATLDAQTVESLVVIGRAPVTELSAPDFDVDEGEVIPAGTAVATFNDPNGGDTFAARVCWSSGDPGGDNCSPYAAGNVVPLGGDDFAIVSPAAFAYRDNGAFVVAVDVDIVDAGNNPAPPIQILGDAIARNLPPLVEPPDVTTTGGTTTARSGFSDPGRDDTHTGTVNWGDGTPTEPATPDPVTTDGEGGFKGAHNYTRPGVYFVKVTVKDDDGEEGFNQTVIEISARDAKEGIVRRLQAMLPTGSKDADKKIGDAIKAVQASLAPNLWSGPNTLDPKKGDHVFNEERKAVQKLRDIKPPKPEGVGGLVDDLVAIDRLFATNALAGEPPGKDKDKATEDLAKGDQARDAGLHEHAIEHYRNAWKRIKQ